MSAADLRTALVDLRRPFTPAAVKFKIQVSPKGKGPAIIVAYIDSRLVAERLNHVVGGEWSDQYGPINTSQGGAFVTCRLTVFDAVREDVGWSKGAATDMDVKAAYSDGFKRAATKFSIGAFLYAMPVIKRWPKDLDSYEFKGETKYQLGEAATAKLVESFTQWTARSAIVDRFGTPIDHGDGAA